ncbi:hypothetical protein C8T65DRAFT_697785 [Cerioporus squamosus]|nr:hypothetical protein C8T65DRAFT_697785 [Cerioporus squamosus]
MPIVITTRCCADASYAHISSVLVLELSTAFSRTPEGEPASDYLVGTQFSGFLLLAPGSLFVPIFRGLSILLLFLCHIILPSSGTTVENTSLSAGEKVPEEIWLEIFKQVPKSSDLHSLSVASRKFCSLTTCALHRDLIWEKESYAANNLDVWKTDAEMPGHVRSLVLGIGGVPSNRTPEQNAAILDNYAWPSVTVLEGHTPVGRRALLSSETFTNLSALVLKNMTLTRNHFRLIHGLARLRSLDLISCIVNGDAADGFDNKTLPITELSMIGVHRGDRAGYQDQVNPAVLALLVQQQGNPPPVFHGPFTQALTLATATNLRTPKVDSSTDIFRYVFDSFGAQDRGWVAPPMLEHLYSFAAPLDTAQFVATYRDVKALGVLKCGLNTHGTIEALKLIALARPGLEVLVFEVKAWDAEIVLVISQHFKQLHRLKLVYGENGPGQNYLDNLGAEVLVDMPQLHTLEMYKLPPNGVYTPEHPTHLFENTWDLIKREALI